jgi:hypothetical protein
MVLGVGWGSDVSVYIANFHEREHVQGLMLACDVVWT